MTTTAATAKDANGFSTIECPRCGGTGELPIYGNVDGGRCFRCNRTGRVHTPKAAKALKAYREALDTATASTAGEAKIGDRVKFGGADTTYRWITVADITSNPNAGCITITDTKGNTTGLPATMKVLNFTQATDAPNIADYAV